MTKLLNNIKTYLKNKSMYYHTISELSRLSDKELQDIGISRGDIPFLLSKSKESYMNK